VESWSPRSTLNPGFRQVGKQSKARSIGGDVQRIAAGIVRGNDDDIVGAMGLSPVEGRGFAL
jgi:hypothetical protein